MAGIEGNALRGHLETMVLSVLERGNAHGYQIIQRLEEAGSGLLTLKEGTLYPVLYRLEKAGFVSAAWENESEVRKGPRRRNYTLRAAGKRELDRRRDGWRTFVNVVGAIVEA